MARYCTVCRHPDVSQINAAILNGEPYRDIGSGFGFSAATVYRHKQHIPGTLVKAHEAREVAVADDLLEQVECLRLKTLRLLERAEKAEEQAASEADQDRHRRTALRALRETRGVLTLLAQLMGELKTGATYNVLISAEWVDLRGQILQAVEPYPEAKAAIIEAVGHVEE